jgi:hypothetical protein
VDTSHEARRTRIDIWPVADFCTLPTAARPLRVAEFDELFRDQVAVPRWIDLHRVEFTFHGADDRYDQVSDLVERETACCSFFDFSIARRPQEAAEGSVVVLRVGVPESHHDVVDSLINRAAAVWAELSDEH